MSPKVFNLYDRFLDNTYDLTAKMAKGEIREYSFGVDEKGLTDKLDRFLKLLGVLSRDRDTIWRSSDVKPFPKNLIVKIDNKIKSFICGVNVVDHYTGHRNTILKSIQKHPIISPYVVNCTVQNDKAETQYDRDVFTAYFIIDASILDNIDTVVNYSKLILMSRDVE